MHDRETVELFLYAREEGMGAREAARLCGVSPHTARNWAAGPTATRGGRGRGWIQSPKGGHPGRRDPA